MIRSFINTGNVVAGMLIITVAQSAAHSPVGSLRADEITQNLKGKICTTTVGAKFTFGQDGEYSYEGLWKNGGRYSINDGAITIILDSGLERSFVISRKGGVLYMEQTTLSCRASIVP